MAANPEIVEYWTELRKQLTPGSLARIDFDELDRRIESLLVQFTAREEISGELNLLRTDLERRLCGMLKAIAAVERTTSGLEAAAAQIEQVPSLKAGDLLKKYQSVSARFRDFFPGSLGLQQRLSRTESTRLHPGDYK